MGKRRRGTPIDQKYSGAFMLILLPIFGAVSTIFFFIVVGKTYNKIPFKILYILTLTFAVTGILSCALVFVCAALFMNDVFDDRWFLVSFVVFRFLYGIVSIVLLFMLIILAVGFFSLQGSLEVLFVNSYEIFETLNIQKESINNPTDWIEYAKGIMTEAGIMLLISSFFAIIASFGLLCSRNDENDHLESMSMDRLLTAFLQIITNLLLFLPLPVLGREKNLAPFGFVVISKHVFGGLYVLAIVGLSLAALNAVLFFVKVLERVCCKTPEDFFASWVSNAIAFVTHLIGGLGIVVSILLVVWSGLLLGQLGKVKDNFNAFCPMENWPDSEIDSDARSYTDSSRGLDTGAIVGSIAGLHTSSSTATATGKGMRGRGMDTGSYTHASLAKEAANTRTGTGSTAPPAECVELVTRFTANMCAAVAEEEEGEGEGEGEEAGAGEGEGESLTHKCAEKYTPKYFQQLMVKSMRNWMGYMGFAYMFLSLIHGFFSLIVCLPSKDEYASASVSPSPAPAKEEERTGTGTGTGTGTRTGVGVTSKGPEVPAEVMEAEVGGYGHAPVPVYANSGNEENRNGSGNGNESGIGVLSFPAE